MFQKSIIIIYLFYSLIDISISIDCDESYRPVVEVFQGQLQGIRRSTTLGLPTPLCYDSYKGIPYAKPPVGDLSFKAPVPADKWTGIRDASLDGSICPQDINNQGCYKGNQDCLFLNVHVPQIEENNEPLAVMLWIHGGGFVIGTGSQEIYNPSYLLLKNVIVVTINYRLGLYGFLSLETEDYPGNAGLKDQRLAIQWIYENIANFGGDSDRITIFGQSAGGGSVNWHVLSSSSNRFVRAISESGSALSPWAFTSNLRNRTIAVADLLKCSSEDDDEIIKCLQNIETNQILIASKSIQMELFAPGDMLGFVFTPTSEPEKTPDLFFTGNPENIYNIEFNKVDYISGVNTAEFIYFSEGWNLRLPELNSNFQVAFPDSFKNRILNLNKSLDTFTKDVKKFYFGEEELTFANFNTFIQLESDINFIAGSWEAINKLSVNNPSNNYYFYQFSFIGELSYFKGNNILNGVNHGDEIAYLFYANSLASYATPADSFEKIIVENMTTMWTDFAKTGTLPALWTTVRNGEINYLNINKSETSEPSMENSKNQLGKRLKFWKEQLQY